VLPPFAFDAQWFGRRLVKMTTISAILKSSEEAMVERTAFLGKLIGIYCILVAIAMGINKQATIQTVMVLVRDGPLLFVFGLIMVAAGVAMILRHNIWSGGALPVIVTIVGWLTLLKGLAFLFFPPPSAVGIDIWGTAYERFFYLDIAAALVLGIYLTVVAFSGNVKASAK
jgi:hypothetical protein